jgi:hypothetical protein
METGMSSLTALSRICTAIGITTAKVEPRSGAPLFQGLGNPGLHANIQSMG